MTGTNSGTGRNGQALPSMEQLLRYNRQLDGDAFTRQVLAVAAHRRRRRVWILSAAAALAPVAIIAIKPDKFSYFSNLHFPLQGVSETVAALPVGGLLAMLLVSILVMGVSKTVDSI